MDLDDLTPSQPKPLDFAKEDLADYSLSALEDRVAALEAEIARCRALIESKQGSRQEADGLFKI